MTCEEARKNLPLFLYGELSFDEEELVEVHIDECAACRKALAREKAMFAALDGVELVPSSRGAGGVACRIAAPIGPGRPTAWRVRCARFAASGTRSARDLPFTFTLRPASRRWPARRPCWRWDF